MFRLSILLCVTHMAFAGSIYSVVDLGVFPGGHLSVAEQINSKGQVAGWASTRSGDPNPFYWPGSGPIQDIGTLGGADAYAYAVNDSGEVVGSSRPTMPGGHHAFYWTTTTGIQDLGLTACTGGSLATGINLLGTIVGTCAVSDGSQTGFVWTQSSGAQDFGNAGGGNTF
jgi:probable HAF family extracellular repeat protein